MTGLLYITVTPNGQRTFFGSRGANRTVRLQPRDLALVKRARAAILMGYSFLDPHPAQAALRILREVRSRRGWIALDAGMEPSQKIPEKILQIARKVDLLFVSHEEATLLTGQRDPRQAFRKLLESRRQQCSPEIGQTWMPDHRQGEPIAVPPFPVRAVDSTGAGDAFNAAFLQAKLRNWPAAEAALAANAAGAAATQVIGAGEQTPTTRDIARVLRSHRLRAPWDAIRINVLRRMRQNP